MRDIALFLLLAVFVFLSFKRPLYPGLGWIIFSVMNPHRLAFGPAYDFPFAMILALLTLTSALMKPKERIPKGGSTAAMIVAMLVWCGITTVFAFHPVLAEDYLLKVVKTFMMTLVLLLLVNSRRDVVMVVAALALSLAYYGTKGGVFVFATGGKFMVNGPEDSVMAGNNALGVGLTICIPLMYFLYRQLSKKWHRWAMLGAMFLCAVSVLGTYSRGALLAVAAIAVLLMLRSQNRIMLSVVSAVFIAAVVPMMPEQWFERMSTISEHEEDASAMGRIYAWHTATNIAKDRFPLAGGFEWHGKDTSERYSPNPDSVFVAHSIYFQTLGSQGFIGLGLFLLLWVSTYWRCGRLRKLTKGRADLEWARLLVSMVQVSLVGYAVGGAFLDLAFWDLPYYLITAVVGTEYVVRQTLGRPTPAQVPEPAGLMREAARP